LKKVLCLISSPPESAQVTRGLALARTWLEKGHSVQIGLLQDGIYSGLNGTDISINDALTGAEWFALEDDLRLRGFSTQDLRTGVHQLDYPKLIKMMMEDSDQVLGAF